MTEFWTPGETHYPTDPAFYPGEVDALWGVNNSAVESAVWAEGGTSATVASPASFIAGGGAWIYEKYDPRPDITQGYWLVRVRGTGTLVFSTGVDAASDWDWYYTTQEIAWSSAGTEDVNTAEFTDLHVPIAPYVFTQANMEDGTFLLQVEVTSGSVEFDVMDFRCASDYGYHRETGSGQYSEWQDREFRVVNGSAGRAQLAEATVLFGDRTPTVYWQGAATTPPYTDIRAQIDTGFPQLFGAVDAGPYPPEVTSTDDEAYYSPPGSYYHSSEGSGSSLFGESRVAQWHWEDYYPGMLGIPPRDAFWHWGTGDSTPSDTGPHTRRNAMIGAHLRFVVGSVVKPTVNVLMAEKTDLVNAVHYSGGQYEAGVDPDFINWEPALPTLYVSGEKFPDVYFHQQTWDNTHGHAVNPDQWHEWASAPIAFEARVIPGWQVGDPIPGPTDGVVVATASFSPSDSPTIQYHSNAGVVPYEQFGLFVFRTSGHGGARMSAAFAPRVLLPRWQYYQPEWEYLGGFVSENGPPLNFVMVTNDC